MSEYYQHYNISSILMDNRSGFDVKRHYYAFRRDPEDAKYETYIDLKTWPPLYNGDPQNWHYLQYGDAILPFYVDDKKMCHFVKFNSRRDYYKMKRVLEKKKSSMEQEANLQEQLELSTIIRKRALERSKEALERQKKAEEELRNLTEQIVNMGTQSTLKTPEERRAWAEPRHWDEL